ncbi:adenylyl-sulfate kinase [Piscinibacter terrae]|uniref:adenylyl-sulfate kinase n=1 Tax=Piscinibacter terrae TaxID=2496871 RepID=UPI0018E0914B|nr:adenylyl-sulfate kinase [Albitalea terrae]
MPTADTVWMTGLSGAGKSTLADVLARMLRREGRPCIVLDGDAVREGLSRGLGFSDADRLENMRRVAEVARLANDSGVIAIVALISPLEEGRRLARRIVGTQRFIEVHVSTPIEICARRDPKGLYAGAHAGKVTAFTGVSSAYEVPASPDLRVDTSVLSAQECAMQMRERLQPWLG